MELRGEVSAYQVVRRRGARGGIVTVRGLAKSMPEIETAQHRDWHRFRGLPSDSGFVYIDAVGNDIELSMHGRVSLSNRDIEGVVDWLVRGYDSVGAETLQREH